MFVYMMIPVFQFPTEASVENIVLDLQVSTIAGIKRFLAAATEQI